MSISGFTPLMLAKTETEVINLLESNADPTQRSDYGHTALHFAKNSTIAKILLDANADPNASNYYGVTPIFFTSDLDTCKILVDYNANINHIAYSIPGYENVYDGISPLCNAMNSYTLTQHLISLKADPSLRCPNNDHTPLYKSLRLMYIDGTPNTSRVRPCMDINVFEFHIKTTSDSCMYNTKDAMSLINIIYTYEYLMVLFKYKQLPAYDNNNTPCLFTCQNDVRIVQLLLDMKATPHLSLCFDDYTSHTRTHGIHNIDVIKLLISNNISPNSFIGSDGHRIINYVAHTLSDLRLLIEHNGDCSYLLPNAIYTMDIHPNKDITSLLLSDDIVNRCPINYMHICRDYKGYTILYTALHNDKLLYKLINILQQYIIPQDFIDASFNLSARYNEQYTNLDKYNKYTVDHYIQLCNNLIYINKQNVMIINSIQWNMDDYYNGDDATINDINDIGIPHICYIDPVDSDNITTITHQQQLSSIPFTAITTATTSVTTTPPPPTTTTTTTTTTWVSSSSSSQSSYTLFDLLLNCFNRQGYTALALCVEHHYPQAFSLLLQYNADIFYSVPINPRDDTNPVFFIEYDSWDRIFTCLYPINAQLYLRQYDGLRYFNTIYDRLYAYHVRYSHKQRINQLLYNCQQYGGLPLVSILDLGTDQDTNEDTIYSRFDECYPSHDQYYWDVDYFLASTYISTSVPQLLLHTFENIMNGDMNKKNRRRTTTNNTDTHDKTVKSWIQHHWERYASQFDSEYELSAHLRNVLSYTTLYYDHVGIHPFFMLSNDDDDHGGEYDYTPIDHPSVDVIQW